MDLLGELGRGERQAAHAVVRAHVDEIGATEQESELAGVHLGHEHAVVAAQDVAEVGREGVDVAQVCVGDRGALAPGLAAGVIAPEDVVVVAASGTSGAGKGLKPHLLGAEVMGAMSPYGVGGVHRHTPEIEQNLTRAAGAPVTVSFTPTLAPMSRGILATCTARIAPGADAAAVRKAWAAAYADEPFVELLPEGAWPRTSDVLGANLALVQVVVDDRVGRVVAVAAIDNLTKGTAGAAVQCINLALGLPERAGLPAIGVAP